MTRHFLTLVILLMGRNLALAADSTPPKQKTLTPTTYEKRLEACRIHAGDIQAEPYLKEGVVTGFRYTQIRPGSAYSRAGFKPGDILIEQNGVKLHAPEDIVVAFETAKEGEPQISTVLRADKIIKFRMACPTKKK